MEDGEDQEIVTMTQQKLSSSGQKRSSPIEEAPANKKATCLHPLDAEIEKKKVARKRYFIYVPSV